MNDEAIYEIADFLRITSRIDFCGKFPFIEVKKLSAEEIIGSHEFAVFQKDYPKLIDCVIESRCREK